MGDDGKIHFVNSGGADSVLPFSSDLKLVQTDKYNTGKSSGTNSRKITLTNDIDKGYIISICSAAMDASGATATSFSLKSSNTNSTITKVCNTTNSFNHGTSYANAMIITVSSVKNLKKNDVLTASATTGESAAFITMILS